MEGDGEGLKQIIELFFNVTWHLMNRTLMAGDALKSI